MEALDVSVATAVVGGGLLLGLFVLWMKRSGGEGAKKGKGASPKIPPGPKPSHPELGNLGDMGAAGSLHEYLLKLHSQYKSDVVSFWFATTQTYSICSGEAFGFHNPLFDRPPLLFKLFEPLIGSRSLQYANGEDGKNRRKVYDTCFSHQNCAKMLPIFNKVGGGLVERLSKHPEGADIDLMKEVVKSAIEAIAAAAFGDYFGDHPDRVDQLAESYHIVWSEMEERLLQGDPANDSDREIQFTRHLANIKQMISEVVESRRQNPPDVEDALFVDVVIRYWGDDQETILADCVSYMIGGFHTTLSSLTWAIYYVSSDEKVQEKLLNEIRSVLGDSPEVEVDHLNDLKYCRQVLDEALRAGQVAPMAARVNDEEDMVIKDFFVPKGTPVVQALGVSLMDPDVFPEPEKFDPDRFEESRMKKMKSNAFVPFGFAGKRKCPGYRFAYMEQVTWLVKWFSAFEFTISPNTSQPVKKVFHLVTLPADPIYVNIRPRSSVGNSQGPAWGFTE